MEFSAFLILQFLHLELVQKCIKIMKESKQELFDENIESIEDLWCSKTIVNPAIKSFIFISIFTNVINLPTIDPHIFYQTTIQLP